MLLPVFSPSSSPWSLEIASPNNVSFDFSSQDATPKGLIFNNTGSKCYIAGDTTNKIYEYDLSVNYNVSTATYNTVSLDVSSQSTTPYGLFLGDSGTKLYVVMNGIRTVFQYGLSVAYDLSTATYSSKSFSVASQTSDPTDVLLSNSGDEMYVTDPVSGAIFQYTLSTSWDVSTASYASKSLNTTSQEATPSGAFLKPDGTRIFVVGTTNDSVYQYSLSSANDLSTASYDSISLDISSVSTNSGDVVLNASGDSLYVLDAVTAEAYGYSL